MGYSSLFPRDLNELVTDYLRFAKMYLDVPLEARINGLFHLLVNAVSWGLLTH